MGRRISIGVVLALGVAGAAAPGGAVAAARGGPAFSAHIVRSSRQAVLRARTLRVRVVARGYGRVRVGAVVRRGTTAQRRRGGSRLLRSAAFTVHGTRTLRLRLTAAGFRALRDCRTARVVLTATARRARRAHARHAGLTYARVRGGCHGGLVDVPGAPRGTAFRVGAAVGDFTPPAFGHAPGGRPGRLPARRQRGLHRAAGLRLRGALRGLQRQRTLRPARSHGPDRGRAVRRLQRQRALGRQPARRRRRRSLLRPVADPVGARALVVSNGKRTIAVEVLDQEGLFNIYIQRIRAARRRRRLPPRRHLHLRDARRVGARHARDLGQSPTTSSVNAYYVDFLVARSAQAIEQALPRDAARVRALRGGDRARQPAAVLVVVPVRRRPAHAGAPGRRHRRHGDRDARRRQPARRDVGFNRPRARRAEALDQRRLAALLPRPRSSTATAASAIEMAGSVGSNETPQVFAAPISRDAAAVRRRVSHPAGCRTLFDAHGHRGAGRLRPGDDDARRAARRRGRPDALDRGGTLSDSERDLGRAPRRLHPAHERAVHPPARRARRLRRAPGLRPTTARSRSRPRRTASTSGTELLSRQVAAFRIGDGEFISCPARCSRSRTSGASSGPQDMPNPSYGAARRGRCRTCTRPYRFVDGLAEDMLGYIFPRGNGVGVPGSTTRPTRPATAPTASAAGTPTTARRPRRRPPTCSAARSSASSTPTTGRPSACVTGRYVLGDGTGRATRSAAR